MSKTIQTFPVYVPAKAPNVPGTYYHWYINTYSYNEVKLTRAHGTHYIAGTKLIEIDLLVSWSVSFSYMIVNKEL